jgi:hypothetical protein
MRNRPKRRLLAATFLDAPGRLRCALTRKGNIEYLQCGNWHQDPFGYRPIIPCNVVTGTSFFQEITFVSGPFVIAMARDRISDF